MNSSEEIINKSTYPLISQDKVDQSHGSVNELIRKAVNRSKMNVIKNTHKIIYPVTEAYHQNFLQ